MTLNMSECAFALLYVVDAALRLYVFYFSCRLLTDAMKVHPCLRYYVLRWYEIYVRGMGARFPPPYYNGTLELPPVLHA